MDMISFIIDAVSNQAFAIVMCAALFWKINQQDKDHKEEVSNLVKAIDNNTVVVAELLSHFRDM